jgi:hypothetical protein
MPRNRQHTPVNAAMGKVEEVIGQPSSKVAQRHAERNCRPDFPAHLRVGVDL